MISPKTCGVSSAVLGEADIFFQTPITLFKKKNPKLFATKRKCFKSVFFPLKTRQIVFLMLAIINSMLKSEANLHPSMTENSKLGFFPSLKCTQINQCYHKKTNTRLGSRLFCRPQKVGLWFDMPGSCSGRISCRIDPLQFFILNTIS